MIKLATFIRVIVVRIYYNTFTISTISNISFQIFTLFLKIKKIKIKVNFQEF